MGVIFLKGLGMGASLIIAIGAQNAFVLVQGIRRNHHVPVAGLCALLDAILISAGVLGLGTLVASSPVLRLIAGIGGALFLFIFGLKSLLRVRKRQSLQADTTAENQRSLQRTLLATLAVSLLNPHVYLDTVVMLGVISGNYAGNGRYLFGLGAVCASLCWFFLLAQCGKWLAPAFSRPRAWQVLNVLVCLTVWIIAFGLIRGVWREFA